MSKSNPQLNGGTRVKSMLALTRISRWHHIAPDTIQAVRDELASALGLKEPRTNAGLQQPAAVRDSNGTDLNAAADQEPTKLNARVRQLITAGASWQVLSEYLWQDFAAAPTPRNAARILETAFVQARPEETLAVFNHLMSTGLKACYWFLHPKLRDFLVEHSPEQHLDQLYGLIARERDDSVLTGIELLYIFLRVAMTSDKTAAWMYFRRHQTRILNAFGNDRHFGMTRAQFIIRAGELALGMGYLEDTRDLFQTIPAGTIEHETALQLLYRYEGKTFNNTKDRYLTRLESTDSWQERVILISGFCDASRNAGGVRDPNRAALDQLLSGILQWVPRMPDAWRTVSEVLLRHRDLAPALPGVLKPLFDNSATFHGPDMDYALWQPIADFKPTSTQEAFLQAVALLHKYVAAPRYGEKIFWDSHKAFLQLESSPTGMQRPWRDLLKSAAQWSAQSAALTEPDRKRCAAAIKLALDGALASQETVSQYLDQCNYAPEHILREIARNAADTGKNHFAVEMLIKAGQSLAFTNKNLTQLWSLTCRDPSPDLPWRVATILAARDVLPEKIRIPWEISGEKRAAYAPTPLTEQDIDRAMTDLSKPSQRVARALCVLGTKLNEFALIDGAASLISPSLAGTSTIEQSIVTSLKASVVIPKATKTVVETGGIHMTPTGAAPLAQAIINNPWIFSARLLAERLSITSWGWSVTVLEDYARPILPLLGKDPAGRINARKAKLIASLSSSERTALNEITRCVQLESAETLSNNLVKFICRLAVILYPSHLSALKTVQHIRMPLDIIRDLEWFIVSGALTDARARHNIFARVAIPDGLKSNDNAFSADF